MNFDVHGESKSPDRLSKIQLEESKQCTLSQDGMAGGTLTVFENIAGFVPSWKGYAPMSMRYSMTPQLHISLCRPSYLALLKLHRTTCHAKKPPFVKHLHDTTTIDHHRSAIHPLRSCHCLNPVTLERHWREE